MQQDSLEGLLPNNSDDSEALAKTNKENTLATHQQKIEKAISVLFRTVDTHATDPEKKIDIPILREIIDLLSMTSADKLDLNAIVEGIPLLTYFLHIAIIANGLSSNVELNATFAPFEQVFFKFFQKKQLLTYNWHQAATKFNEHYAIELGQMPVHSMVQALIKKQRWAIKVFKDLTTLSALEINWSVSSPHIASPLSMALYSAVSNESSAPTINPVVAFFLNEYLHNTKNKIDLNATNNDLPFLYLFIEIAKQHTPSQIPIFKNNTVELCENVIKLLDQQSVSANCLWGYSSKNRKGFSHTPLHALTTSLDQQWAVSLLSKIIDAEVISAKNWLQLNDRGQSPLGNLIHYCSVKMIAESTNGVFTYTESEVSFIQETATCFSSILPNSETSQAQDPVPSSTIDLNNKLNGIPLLTYLLNLSTLIAKSSSDPSDPLIRRFHSVITNMLTKNSLPSEYDWNLPHNNSNHLFLHPEATALIFILYAMKLKQRWAFQLFKAITNDPKVKLNWSMNNLNTSPLWQLVNILYNSEQPTTFMHHPDDIALVRNYLLTLFKTLSTDTNAKNIIYPHVDVWQNYKISTLEDSSIYTMIASLTKQGQLHPQLLLELVCNPCIPLKDFPLIAKTIKDSFINTLLESKDPLMQTAGFAFIILRPQLPYDRALSAHIKVNANDLRKKIIEAANKIHAFDLTQQDAPATREERLKTDIIVDGITSFLQELPLLQSVPRNLLEKIIKKGYLTGSFRAIPTLHYTFKDQLDDQILMQSHSFKVATVTARDAFLNALPSKKLLAHLDEFLSKKQNNNVVNPPKKNSSFNPLQAYGANLLDSLYDMLIELRNENVLPRFLNFTQREAIRRAAAKLSSLDSSHKNDIKSAITNEIRNIASATKPAAKTAAVVTNSNDTILTTVTDDSNATLSENLSLDTSQFTSIATSSSTTSYSPMFISTASTSTASTYDPASAQVIATFSSDAQCNKRKRRKRK